MDFFSKNDAGSVPKKLASWYYRIRQIGKWSFNQLTNWRFSRRLSEVHFDFWQIHPNSHNQILESNKRLVWEFGELSEAYLQL